MGYYDPCEICGIKPATQAHHLLPQTSYWISLYPEYIHHTFNLQYLCCNCHNGFTEHITEEEFCGMFNIDPRSKEHKLRKMREENGE